jgi:uncharacterized protein (TIGR02058 family)
MPAPFAIEIGMGVDLQGADPTKACVRAVRDAIGRVFLSGLRAPLDQGGRLTVLVRLAIPSRLGPPDLAPVRAAVPHGEVAFELVEGGMLAPNGLDDGLICIVNAAIEVHVDR